MSIPDNGDRDAFDTGAVRDVTTGKPRPSLLPPLVYQMLAMRATEGAAKYNDHNWAKGIPMSRYVDAIQRHLWAYLEKDKSEDHLAAIMWNAGALAWTEQQVMAGNLPVSLYDLYEWNPEGAEEVEATGTPEESCFFERADHKGEAGIYQLTPDGKWYYCYTGHRDCGDCKAGQWVHVRTRPDHTLVELHPQKPDDTPNEFVEFFELAKYPQGIYALDDQGGCWFCPVDPDGSENGAWRSTNDLRKDFPGRYRALKVSQSFPTDPETALGYIEDPNIREAALGNLKGARSFRRSQVNSIGAAIDCFSWSRTPEGHTFWQIQAKKYGCSWLNP